VGLTSYLQSAINLLANLQLNTHNPSRSTVLHSTGQVVKCTLMQNSYMREESKHCCLPYHLKVKTSTD